MSKQYNEILLNLIQYAPVNKKVRWGHEGDGGYVVVGGYDYDSFISAGIGNEVTFEQDFVKHNPDTLGYAYDGTCDRPEDLPESIQFIQKNIDSVLNTNTATTLTEIIQPYDDVFLKFDIEGEEWNWIKSFRHFDKCKQITFEAHAIYPIGVPGRHRGYLVKTNVEGNRVAIPEAELLRNILESLQVLNKTHRLVHTHQNADAPYFEYNGNQYPTFLELTFLRKDCEFDGLNEEDLPIKGLDFPSGRSDPAMIVPSGAHYDPFYFDKDMSFYPFVDERARKWLMIQEIIDRTDRLDELYSELDKE